MSVSRSLPDTGLLDRHAERAAIDGVLETVRAGSSAVLVLLGEPGIGKTALLDYAADRALGFRVIRAWGVESEMDFAFAGLHQLCVPMLSRLDQLPSPQRDALEVAFGMRAGQAPDRFLVGLATLSLVAAMADDQPLACLVDDAQWLDQESAQALAFVARRLLAERAGLVFAAREPDEQLRGLPDLEVRGLRNEDAGELLRSVVRVRLDERVRDRVLAETKGNPLALLELPRGLSPTQLAGGFGLVGAQAVPARIEESYRRRLEALPADTRLLLLIAAAEPVGDPVLVWDAAERLGIPSSAAMAAESDGLLEMGTQVRFRHPLVRSAAYWSATPQEQRTAHLALAEVTDRELDPDRRAWHLAAAASGPDEEVASELEWSADRARARGGMAATAAFLQRAVALTREPKRRAERALTAAQANLQAGAFDAAIELLATAEAGPLDELQRAQAELLRGQIAFASSAGSEAPALLLKAARELEALDVTLARETYLDAWAAAMFAGRPARAGDLHEVSRAVRSAPPPADAPRPSDLLLDGLAVLVTDGRGAAASSLRQVAHIFAEEAVPPEEGLRWGWLASVAAIMVWDEESWHLLLARQLDSVREAGLLFQLPLYVNVMGVFATWRGDFATAASLITEADAIADVTGTRLAPFAAAALAGFRGEEAEASRLIEAVTQDPQMSGQGGWIQWSQLVSAILYNGLGRYDKALAQARLASEHAPELYVSMWALPELIEAASRTGKTRLAADAFESLTEATSVADTDWGLGIHARSRALLSEGREAEDSYREAIERLNRTRFRSEPARAHLLYGEWLRREGRRTDARTQLYAAHEMFAAIGMEGFAERARRELLATGETVRKTAVDSLADLTPQEAQIANLARDGYSNQEIASRLFISPRTVEWHLGNVFAKLGITSRKDLR